MQRDIGGFYGSSDVTIGGTSVSLTLFKPSASPRSLQPLTTLTSSILEALMNITGPSVLSALRKSVRTPAHLVVIHDSLSHKPQTVSHKFAGSANGHNGVKSVISSLNKTEFHRLRVGIGRDNSVDPAAYVLGKLSGQEQAFWTQEGIDVILKELEKLIPSVSPR
jgi:peptidyl-tRNA hydrolase, PTH1 family